MRTPRQAARVAVLDAQGALFLFRHDDEEVGVHWAVPGGGLEAGETPRAGAERELREETGWTDPRPGPLLCTWEHDFTRDGVPVRQHEHIFLAYGPTREPSESVADVLAAEGMLRWHWWSPAELAAAAEPLWPPRLAELLADRRAEAAPEPVHFGFVPHAPPGAR